jgi:hypothetical protein
VAELELGEMEGAGGGWWGRQHSHVSKLNATELCTETWLRGYVLRYILI